VPLEEKEKTKFQPCRVKPHNKRKRELLRIGDGTQRRCDSKENLSKEEKRR